MTEIPQSTPGPVPEAVPPTAAGEVLSPAERVATSMHEIAGMVETDFVTDMHRAAFMTSVEVQLDREGHIARIRPEDPGYSEVHLIRYMAVNGEGGQPLESDLKLHQPQSFPGMFEYTQQMPANATSVQRGGTDQHETPKREDDALYVEWVRDALRGELGKMHALLDANPDDPALPVNQYANPDAPISDEVNPARPPAAGGYVDPGQAGRPGGENAGQ